MTDQLVKKDLTLETQNLWTLLVPYQYNFSSL